MTSKTDLRLVDGLPDEEVEEAARVPGQLRPGLPAFLRDAPEDDEPVTEEDIEALAEAYEDSRAGRMVSHEEIERELRG